MITAALAGVFAWSFITPSSQNSIYYVPLIPGALAAVAFVVVLASYFAAPPNRLAQSTMINYFLCLVAVIILVASRGIDSPYTGLLVLLAPFASVFGAGASISSLAMLMCLLLQQYAINIVTVEYLLTVAAALAVANVAGLALWLRPANAKDLTAEDRSYHELASQLDQATGTSEVVINTIGEGVLALDGKGNIKLINPAAQQLIGWGDQDAIGLSYESVLKLVNDRSDPIPEKANPVAQALANNQPAKDDTLSIQTQSGKSFIASVSVNPVGERGDGVIAVFRDITVERSDERQRAEFISTASHEMRTPVASIEGYLGLALNPQTATIDARAMNYITKAHESAQHLGRLFSDLLDISRADDHRLKNDPHIVNVVSFVGDIAEGLTPQAVEKGLQIIYKPNQTDTEDGAKHINPVFYANVDNDHLREITQNLIENAIKYTPSGTITVDITGDDGHVTISVADTGIGIPREDQSHLFQKFYRVDNRDTREIGGTGLGLYLCRKLAETIGGRLWVESEYKQGSTFYLSVPRVDHATAQRLMEQSAKTAAPKPSQSEASDAPIADFSHPLAAVPAKDAEAAEVPEPAQPAPPEPQYTNTPLSAIEANPELYAQQLRKQISLAIPQRKPPKE